MFVNDYSSTEARGGDLCGTYLDLVLCVEGVVVGRRCDDFAAAANRHLSVVNDHVSVRVGVGLRLTLEGKRVKR